MSNLRKSILFITDPVGTFNPEAETTSFLMHEAARRGYEIWQSTLEDLFFADGHVQSLARYWRIEFKADRFLFHLKEEAARHLYPYEMILLRKDPPVDQAYIYHLQLLSLLEEREGPVLINRPSGILQANEKLLPLRFPHLFPETVVTCRLEIFESFLKTHGDIILKPLNLSGGRGIYRIKDSDANAEMIFRTQTSQYRDYQVLQRFLPEAHRGDKRILVCGGEILGAFIRVPSENDFRGNMHQGATWHAVALTARDHEIVQTLSPTLAELGLFFVGIDIIGEYVTEINCTSPMGIRELNQLYGSQVEKTCWDSFEKRLSPTIA